MNWYSKIKTSQQEPWQISKDDYTVIWREDYPGGISAHSDKRTEWEKSISRAISEGKITPEQAVEKGWSKNYAREVQPLPAKLYHVTTAKDKVIAEGIKTREELKQTDGKGLGGGESDTISFTVDLPVAMEIKNAMLEAKQVALGNMTIQDMIDYAKNPPKGVKPFLREFMGYFTKNMSGEIPEEIKYLSQGIQLERTSLPRTVEEYNRQHDGEWEGLPQYRWEHGAKDYIGYRGFARKISSQEKIQRTFNDVYKVFSAYRESAGGPLNPLFFSNDVEGLADTPDDQIAIIEYRPIENAYGKQQSGLKEWRTWSGKAVVPVRVI